MDSATGSSRKFHEQMFLEIRDVEEKIRRRGAVAAAASFSLSPSLKPKAQLMK